MWRHSLASAAIMVMLTGCNDGLEQALEFAGDNRSELEKVLEHFSGDGEKQDAAKFLIANMPGHKCMIGQYREYYAEAERVLCQEAGCSALDSLESIALGYDSRIRYEYVSKVIDAKYLINDIGNAFAQWRDGEWAHHLSFADFCEWLLPYTCSDSQPLDDWRTELESYAKKYIDELHVCTDYQNNPRAAVCRVNDYLIASIDKQLWIHSAHGFPIYDPEIFAELPGATCTEYAEMTTLIMRSKGIPVGIDFTPQWPDRQYGHSWCVFPTLRGKTSMFNPYSSNPDYPHYTHAKFAKVFRRTYRADAEYLKLVRKHHGNIPPMLQSPFFKDVTDEYVRTADLKVPIMDGVKLSRKDVYIAVFDNMEWRPVYWGRKRGRKACFRRMGPNVTYLAMGYVKGKLQPVSLPFRLNSTYKIEYIRPDWNGKKCKFSLWRKYPMFQHVFKIHEQIQGGCVLASDFPDFHECDTIATFPDWTLTSGIAEVKTGRPYRYWTFSSGNRDSSELAELIFYPEGDAGYNVCGTCDSANQPFENLFDRNPLTNFKAGRMNCSAYVDFGRPVKMDHVSYIRRGDGNAIVPGDRYEIYIWRDSGWVLHSEYVADDVKIDVTDIPAGALCYVKGMSRGVQNRIFRYDCKKKEVVWL